jgi:signal transduction histidine kinase
MADGMPPDPAQGAELVHVATRTQVSRLSVGETQVVRKQPRGPDARQRLEHERAMLKRLRGVRGVAQLLDAPQYPGSIVMADAGETNLADRARPLAVEELLDLAVELARAVAGMHHCGVMHRDITPANVVVSVGGVPTLVDFALATSLAETRPEFTHHSQIVGTLAYLAPEQTGRTGRSVDQRADLYALGATLYELATGAPPFGFGDPLRLTHDHLARVPVPPAQVDPTVPEPLSAIVMHLLEKEPDSRYQTAEGVVHDLERLRDARTAVASGALRVGERDVPLRFLPPSWLVGRDDEVAALQAAFEAARDGECRVVLIGGAPGVGKTALVDQLRPVVTGSGGWFVAGKFDQFRRDLEFDGVAQAFRALGRLLLAEPEDELSAVRDRIRAGLGSNAGMATAVIPEFAALLLVPPDPGDPLTAQVRAGRIALEILRATASPQRPMVFFIDDLQWAGSTPLGLFDLLLGEEPVNGLLLVGAYRDDDVHPTHPLAGPLSRSRERTDVQHLHLDNLPVPAVVGLVAEMVHADRIAVAELVEAITLHADGNPYETVELLNGLRREGLVAATPVGWRWDIAAVRAHLSRSEPARLLVVRVEALPERARATAEVVACLGGQVDLSVVQAATGDPAVALVQALAPALDEGLLVMEPGARQVVRFRHDRIRHAIMQGFEPGRRRTVQLAMARRLADVPELFAVAAEQYLPVVDAVDDEAERHQVVRLLRRAADQARLIGDYVLVNALLGAALQLSDHDDTATLVGLRTARHAALYSMGNLEEADEEFRTIEKLRPGVVQRADARYLQVRSLSHRKRFADAIGLAVESLCALGIAVPAADERAADLDRQFEHLYRWLDHSDSADDLARPEISDPALVAATRLIDAVLPGAYFTGDLATYGWLSLEGVRIWLEHGPGRTLIGPASTAAFAAAALRGDHAAGYRALRRILAVGEARGYEPDTSQARHRFDLLAWMFESIEDAAHEALRAREGLLAGGDPTAAYTYYPTAYYLLDCAPTLDEYIEVMDAALAFVRRIGSEHIRQMLVSYRWLAGVLRGEGSFVAGEAVHADEYADNPVALFFAHVNSAVGATVLGDRAALARHTAAATPLLSGAPGLYPTAVFHLLRALALTAEVAAGDGNHRGELLAALDEETRWLAARAADAPENFLHLLRLVEAERAWAVGDFRAAAVAFDGAQNVVGRRPWHRALIAERAARFSLAHGLDRAGTALLAEARREYATWGATAKVAQLDRAYPNLRAHLAGMAGHGDDHHGDAPVTTGMIDLLAVLSASQALSSETNVERLHARVVDVLSAMTGATGVHLLLSSDQGDWLVPVSGLKMTPIVDPPRESAVPMSVLRYARRVREPLVVADAIRDDRFSRDPYFAGLDRCSLLVLPILGRGTLRAILLLENRLIRGAFTTDRIDAVTLIAGQLAVSLDNAQLYAELTASRARVVATADQTRRRIERDLHDGAQQRLVSLALHLRATRAMVPLGLDQLTAQLDRATAEATAALDELRGISRGLHPAVLAQGGLRAACAMLARRSPVPIELDVRVPHRLPEQVEVSAYYIVAEALTNAVKHAHASAVGVVVDLNADATVLHLTVRDNGTGGASLTRGTGLIGLKDRAEALGGLLSLDSPRGTGTVLHVELPLDLMTSR